MKRFNKNTAVTSEVVLIQNKL